MISSDEEEVNGGKCNDIFEYDSDGLRKEKGKSKIEPLPTIDHSKINYKPFSKNIYVEHKSLKDIDPSAVRAKLDISVVGNNVPNPITEFIQAGLI